jgi:hypothetical protein
MAGSPHGRRDTAPGRSSNPAGKLAGLHRWRHSAQDETKRRRFIFALIAVRLAS